MNSSIDKFTYKIYIPTYGKYYWFSVFDNSMYLTLIKHIQNNDDDKVSDLFNRIIKELCVSTIDVNNLTCVDIFVILLNIRIMSVSPVFEFQTKVERGKEKVKHNIVIDLYEILNDVTNHELNNRKTLEFTEGYKLTFSLPSNITAKNHDDLIVDLLELLTINDKKYDLKNVTKKQKVGILDELPGDALYGIINHIKQLDQKYRIPVFKEKDAEISTDISNLQLKLFDDSFFEFLKLLYNSNMEEQYYIKYIMVKHMGFDYPSIERMPPIDVQTYVNMYRKELDEQRKAEEKQSGNSVSNMSLPDPGFTQ